MRYAFLPVLENVNHVLISSDCKLENEAPNFVRQHRAQLRVHLLNGCPLGSAWRQFLILLNWQW
jgi:hypothetical protein